jgi:hydroxyacylglutathione hydrolase
MLQVYSYTYSPIQENTYLLYNEQKKAIIIDPGCYFDEEKIHFAQTIAALGVSVEMILLTHCHLDHVFGLKWACETYGCVPRFHKNETTILERASSSALMYNMPFDVYQGAVNYIEEHETITLDNDLLTSMFLPGHSPGSIGYYCQAQNMIIAGDVLFEQSIGRTDLFAGDYTILMHSIKHKLFMLPDNTKVYNGHGNPTTIGAERKYNPFLQ